ncbi:MAG TPA: hypothetical protein VGG94_01690, partial [Chthoniobacterales bacterium]
MDFKITAREVATRGIAVAHGNEKLVIAESVIEDIHGEAEVRLAHFRGASEGRVVPHECHRVALRGTEDAFIGLVSVTQGVMSLLELLHQNIDGSMTSWDGNFPVSVDLVCQICSRSDL